MNTMSALRKNGLQSSCEPCRKTKLRCDHHLPICGRCARTNKRDRCVYHTSPSVNTATRTRTTTVDGTKRGCPSDYDVAGLEPSREDRPAPKSRRLTQSEYMGMTSHFALFKESTEYLGVSALHRSQDIFDNTPSLNLDVIPAESGDVREGAFLLHLLRDLPIYQRVAEAWLKITQDTEFLGRPLVEATFKSLQEFKTRDPSTLRTRSLEIFRLFSVSVPIHNSLSFMDFMASMACRWEIIGLAFSFVALGTVFPCDWDLMFQVEGIPVIPRKDLGLLALSAVELCLRFCNEAGVLNDALSWLTCQHTFLVTLIHGDRDYRSWRALGDLSTIVFTLGLNQPPSDDNTPFWLLEGRKRVMGHAFSADKQMATFLGRPPRISWRFCNVSLPLDISFKDAIAEPSVREIALSRLNANGWNTIESDMQAVWLRVALLMGPVREKILELSLNQQADDLPARINELLQQSEEAWAGLPPFLHHKFDMRLSSRGPTAKESLYLQVHLDYIYNQFLLYRILSKRMNIWCPELIKVSRDILSEVLLLVDSRIRSLTLSPELSWVMSFFGLPVAGVLSIELIRRFFYSCTNTSNPSSPATTTPFPRSQVVQDLTIFASYLQTMIQAYEGNRDICQQARETILRVLDIILSSEATQSMTPAMRTTALTSHPGNDMNIVDTIMDYNYYITHLDNWHFELNNSLGTP